MRKEFEARLDELKQEREEFLSQVNQRLAYFNGAIAEIEAILYPSSEVIDGNSNDNKPGTG